MNYDPVTGQTTVTECECLPFDDCHAEAGAPPLNPCVVPDNGAGTATLPPISCEYESPDEKWMIIEGLPAGTTIEMDGPLLDLSCDRQPTSSCSLPLSPGTCETRGGSLGGDGHCYEATLDVDVEGTGSLLGFSRHLKIPIFAEAHTGPRNPGNPVQTFPAEVYNFTGVLPDDADFCTLTITAGIVNWIPYWFSLGGFCLSCFLRRYRFICLGTLFLYCLRGLGGFGCLCCFDGFFLDTLSCLPLTCLYLVAKRSSFVGGALLRRTK